MSIYLDNSATTPLCAEAKHAMIDAMERFGNPSSLHEDGVAAAALLRECRATIGEALGERFLKDGQLIFTGSGTEASAIALLGSARAKARRSATTILTTSSEHPSILQNLAMLQKEGFRVVQIPTINGAISMDAVRPYLNRDLFMVSMMLVNNETGAWYPVAEVFAAAKAANPDCICHCDAVQGFMKVPFTVKSLGADFVTISAHKVHGPKGVGALYVSPRMLTTRTVGAVYGGGGQEYGYRSGTENTIGIAGFAAAVRAGMARRGDSMRRTTELSEKLIKSLNGSEIQVNLPQKRAPHILSLTLPDIKSETMLHHLSAKGIAVSSGSACSSHAKTPSGTLIAFGLAPAKADCTIRVSLSGENTEADVDALLSALFDGVNTLVRIHH